MLNKDTLIELMEKVRDTGINELIITHDRVEIRAGAAVADTGAAPAAPPLPTPAPGADPAPAATLTPAKDTIPVTAPIPGMVFVAPGNDLHKKPLPTPGTAVKEGDVIALVEAMKMFNEVFAPVDGVVDSIAVGNKTMVKVGDVILHLKS